MKLWPIGRPITRASWSFAFSASLTAVVVAPAYDFETLHLSIVYPGGIQSGPNAGLAATGTVTLVTYSPSGRQVDSKQQPFETLFSLREITPGRWLTTDTPAASKAG